MKLENPYYSTSSLPTYTHTHLLAGRRNPCLFVVVVVEEEDEDDWTLLRNKHVTDTVIDTYTHQKPHRTDKQTDS